MKTKNPLVLPIFYGLCIEYLDTFLFEFKVVCRTCDYKIDSQNLRLFPSTLKYATLRWFMGLKGGSVSPKEEMKEIFLVKYKSYCKSRETKDIFFRMTKLDETFEEYVEHF